MSSGASEVSDFYDFYSRIALMRGVQARSNNFKLASGPQQDTMHLDTIQIATEKYQEVSPWPWPSSSLYEY